ncbi:unnamed protein product [Allacma fusca]|uniref:Nose resistant-to-fluoxetine protein N-terminal domain-containing protein n=1 Tax=Allacma fusca TaxID=39272 RepID=A0A8J2JN54_9HEXA|nr:unnamed protein product [Allacma fusca]
MLSLLASKTLFTIVTWATIILPIVLSQDFPLHKNGRAFEEFAKQYPHLQHLNIDILKRDLSPHPNFIPEPSKGTIFSDLLRYRKTSQSSTYDSLFENVTANCANHLKYTVESLQKLPIDTWILQMLDAWGKVNSGILSGHVVSEGDLKECLQIRGKIGSENEPENIEDVKGKYCVTYLFPGPNFPLLGSGESERATLQNLEPGLRQSVSLELLLQYIFQPVAPSMLPVLGTCFPDSCSTEDVQQFLVSYHKEVSRDFVSQMVQVCYTDEKPPLQAGDWVMIIILGAIALVCIIGTVVDVYGKENLKKGTGMKVILTFSFYTNTKGLLNTKVGADNFTCLNGIRFLTSAWILLDHCFSSSSQTLKWNLVDIRMVYKDWSIYPLLNGTLSVDTFFLMSGFLVAYNLLKVLDKTKGRFNYLLFVIHRYLRLTPVLAIVIGITATIWPYFNVGYYWYEIDGLKEECRTYWWRSLLYINNLYKNYECYNAAWYLNVDMQCFLVSPLLIIPLWKWKKIGLSLLLALSVIGLGARVFNQAYFHQTPTSIPSIPQQDLGYWADFYNKPWVRFDVYVVGIALGYAFYLKTKQPAIFRNISKIIILIGWTLSTIFALGSVYGVMYYSYPEHIEETLHSAHSAAYAGLHRFVWALSISWIIFACVNGYGGFVNKILSLKIFIPLGRLTYTFYLVQFLVLYTHFSMKLHPVHFSRYFLVTEYLGLLLLNIFASYFLYMTIEVPFMLLAKMFLPTNIQPKKPKEKEDLSTIPNIFPRGGLFSGATFKDLFRYRNLPGISNLELFENLTENCAEQLQYVVEAVEELPKIPETWILQMLDSWGKFPSGILSGHTASVGDLKECLQIRGEYRPVGKPNYVSEVKGKYCTTYLFPGPKLVELIGSGKSGVASVQNLDPGLRESASLELLLQYLFEATLPPMLPNLGTCFPASCSTEDLQNLFVSFHKHVSQDWVSQSVEVCYTDEKPPLNAGDWVMIFILAGIALLCIVGTAVDVYGKKEIRKGAGMKIILAFSFYTNTRNWLSTKVGSDNFTCLNGIRFLTSAWILLGHTFSASSQTLNWNNVDIKHIYKDWSAYPILNASLSVDTFFLMSGFLVAYNLLKMLDKTKGKFNYFLFAVHRYLRLTPVVAILVGILATILPYSGDGIFWYEMDKHKELCQTYWWRNLLYISNLFQGHVGEVGWCFYLTWYLDVDMQLFLLSPLIIIPLWRWRKIGIALLISLSTVSLATRTFVTAYFHQTPTNILTIPGKKLEYWADLYTKPWVRSDVYTAGLALGYLFYLKGKHPAMFRNISKIVIGVCWTFSTIFALAIIYVVMYYSDPKNLDQTLNSAHAAAYGGLHRFAWALCISWIIFACVNGYGGWVNKILSLKIFIPLGRLSFSIYLVQFHTLNTYYTMKLHPTHFSSYSVVIEYLGILMVTGFAAYLLLMCVEVPFMHLAKMILPTNAPPPKLKKDKNDEIIEDINGNNINKNSGV